MLRVTLALAVLNMFNWALSLPYQYKVAVSAGATPAQAWAMAGTVAGLGVTIGTVFLVWVVRLAARYLVRSPWGQQEILRRVQPHFPPPGPRVSWRLPRRHPGESGHQPGQHRGGPS